MHDDDDDGDEDDNGSVEIHYTRKTQFVSHDRRCSMCEWKKNFFPIPISPLPLSHIPTLCKFSRAWRTNNNCNKIATTSWREMNWTNAKQSLQWNAFIAGAADRMIVCSAHDSGIKRLQHTQAIQVIRLKIKCRNRNNLHKYGNALQLNAFSFRNEWNQASTARNANRDHTMHMITMVESLNNQWRSNMVSVHINPMNNIYTTIQQWWIYI